MKLILVQNFSGQSKIQIPMRTVKTAMLSSMGVSHPQVAFGTLKMLSLTRQGKRLIVIY